MSLKKIIILLAFNMLSIIQNYGQVNMQRSDSLSHKRNTFKEVFSGNPGKAALYSFLLPGGGQIYNKKWWKLPLTYAIEGGAAYWLLSNRKNFKYYDEIFDDLNNGMINNNEGFTAASQVFPIRARYRKQTEYAWVFMILAHIYNTFDAYVDRHLMEFDISEDLSIQQFPPTNTTPSGSLGLVYKF